MANQMVRTNYTRSETRACALNILDTVGKEVKKYVTGSKWSTVINIQATLFCLAISKNFNIVVIIPFIIGWFSTSW